MGDFTSPNSDLINQERLQRRLEGYRKHHSDNKIHYDNYANAEHEKIKEETKVLYQKWLEGKNKKTKNKSNKSDVNGESNHSKPKPKVNAVKPMVINPAVAERGLESFCPTSKQNVAVCNESQKQPPPSQNASNAGSVRVNINLDANLAQTQNEITVRFSSRITGNNNSNNAAMSNDNKVPNNVNLTGDYNGIQHPCKAESNDLSFCDSSDDFDKLLNSVTVDEDIPIDFEFLNGLDDSNEFLPLNSSLPPATELPLSPCSINNNNIMSQQHAAVVPNQSIIPQQKSTFSNQVTPGHPLAPNFSRIELNISSDMSKFSSILGETPGPAAETLKHLAAKHISQEKVQQKMIHGTDMYPMKTFSPRACYPMQHMQPVNGSFGNDPNGNVMMSGGNFRLPYPASQSMNFDCQSNVTIDTMKVKTPPCYQDKAMFPHQIQVQQPSMQFVGQKLNIASTVKEGDVNLEMKYDFEQCRLSQDGQASSSMMPQGQGMGKAYPNRVAAQANSMQVDCFRMQHQKSYQRYQPYSLQGHPRFNNPVPSAFIQSQSDSGAGMYENVTYGMGMNGRQHQVCMQPPQQPCGPFKQNSMAMVSPMQTRHGVPCVKDSTSMDDFKSGSTGMIEMMPGRYPGMNMVADNSVCHSSMNSQTIQINSPDMFYKDAHQPAYQNFSTMVPATQIRGKWNIAAFPAGHHPVAGKHGAMTPHMQVGYQEINQPMPQNCFPDNRNYSLNGTNSNAAYQFHCNNVQPANQYFTQNLQDGMRMMQYNRPGLQQAIHLQPGLNAGYNPNLKRPAQNMMHPQTRMENFSYGY